LLHALDVRGFGGERRRQDQNAQEYEEAFHGLATPLPPVWKRR
jgi:hypothetical protein